MDADQFWAMVEQARHDYGGETIAAEAADAVAERLVDQLTAVGPDQVVAFQLAFDSVTEQGYRWDLWAAAYLMRGGCSDDGFDYFRGWLIAQGRTMWERAVADPDSLASAGVGPDDDMVECEDILGAASTAYEQLTGDEEAFWAALAAADLGKPDTPDAPAGEAFDFDDDEQMRLRLPRLSAIYLPTT